MNLTERQQREREFYNQHAKELTEDEVVFDPVLGEEKRPFNPYWFVYQQAKEHFSGPEDRLLDFGCGAGSAAMLYAKIGYHVSGFDIGEEHIRICDEKAAKYGFSDRTDFSVQPAEHLDYENESFNVIAGLDILHHIEIGPSIKEVQRILKPGGIAIFREFIEVPIFDTLRNTSLALKMFRRGGCGHHTDDERKLNKNDLAVIRASFPDMAMHRFSLLSRIYQVMPRRNPTKACRIEKFDRLAFKILPITRPLGGEVVLVLRK